MISKNVYLLIIFLFSFSTYSYSLDLPELKLNNRQKNTLSFKSLTKGYDYNRKSLNTYADRNFLSKSILNDGYKLDKNSRDLSAYFSNKLNTKSKKDYQPWDSKKRFWAGASEIALLEFIPFSFSAYLKDWTGSTEKDWTKISFKSMWHNLNSGWFYDGDNFLTNFFAHPYHGNLFYNAGRTNGYNFYESSLFAMTGSAIWEHFMETWEPAFNDWILTSMNGINLGEITYRLSTLVTDNQLRGSDRVWTEIFGAIINPVRGVNRLFTGETYRVFPNPSWRNPKHIQITLSGGARRINKTNTEEFANGIEEGLFQLKVNYGDFINTDYKTPFSSFNFYFDFSTGNPHLTQVQGYGHLYGIHLTKNKKHAMSLIESMNYDFFNNPGFVFGAASLVTNYVNTWKVSKDGYLILNVNGRIMPMAATPNDYFAGPEGRNYDFGPGVGGGLSFGLKEGRWDIINIVYNSGWLWTQSDPAESKHHLHFANLQLQYPLKDYFAIGVDLGTYWRNSYYVNYDDVNFETPVVKLFFKTAIL